MQEDLTKINKTPVSYKLLPDVKIQLGIASAILSRSETSLVEEGLAYIFQKYNIPTPQTLEMKAS